MRIGLVGVGQHARWAVIRAIRETSKRCELGAARDIREQALTELREQGIPVYTDYEEMFRRESLEAAYIRTPGCHASIRPHGLRHATSMGPSCLNPPQAG